MKFLQGHIRISISIVPRMCSCVANVTYEVHIKCSLACNVNFEEAKGKAVALLLARKTGDRVCGDISTQSVVTKTGPLVFFICRRTFSSCFCGDILPSHDVLLTLTNWYLCLNCNKSEIEKTYLANIYSSDWVAHGSTVWSPINRKTARINTSVLWQGWLRLV